MTTFRSQCATGSVGRVGVNVDPPDDATQVVSQFQASMIHWVCWR